MCNRKEYINIHLFIIYVCVRDTTYFDTKETVIRPKSQAYSGLHKHFPTLTKNNNETSQFT